MRLRHLRHTTTAATVVAMATSVLAAAPSVEPTVILVDPVGDTGGITGPVDSDGRVDITEVTYERTGTVATFTIGLADPSDSQPEDVLGTDAIGGISFRADDCRYIVGIDGSVEERCGEWKTIGDASVVLEDDGYRLTFDLAQLDQSSWDHLRAGTEASEPWVWIDRGHLDWTDPLPTPLGTHAGIGLGGCSFCGGQFDEAMDETAYWVL